MNQQLNRLCHAAETLFYLTCTGVVVTGTIDKWLMQVPLLPYGVAVIVLSLLIKIILTAYQPVLSFKRVRTALVISLLSVAAVHLSSTPLTSYNVSFSYPSSPLFALYYAIIITVAITGRGFPLLAVVSIFCTSEILNCAVQGYFLGIKSLSDPQLIVRASLVLPHILYMGLAAGVPYFIVVILNPNVPLRPQNKKGRESILEGSTPEKSITKKTGHEPPEALHPGKTSVLITRQEIEETYVEPDAICDLLSSIVYFMSRNFKAYSSLGFIFDPIAQVFTLNSFHSKSMSINKNIRIPLGNGMVGKLGIEKNSFISGDMTYYSSELLYYTSGTSGSPVNSVLAVPIISESQELLGALVIDSQDKQAFRDEHKDIMRRFSYLAAALITNVRMRMYQERAAKHFRIFYEASQQFIPALHRNQVFDVLITMIAQVTACTRIVAITVNESDGTGTVVKIWGTSPDVQEGFCFETNKGLYSYAFQKGKIVNINDFQSFTGKYFRFSPDESGNEAIRSIIIIPIMGDQQRVSALISLESDQPDQFLGEMETMLFTLVGNAAVALNRARLYRTMELLAITDGLTQLINHKHFQVILEKEMERAKRYKHSLSLLIMDIDHFKAVNDTYGHPVGDVVLKEIAKSIKESLRVNDIAARYGGEEFAVIIPENDERGALYTAERIRQTIEQKVMQSGNTQLKVTISIGCASFPHHAATQQSLIERADKALYYSKRNGRNRVSVFVNEMDVD